MLKFSENQKIYFALFEKVDHWIIAGLIASLKKTNAADIKILNGISYDRYVQDNKKIINANNFPLSLSRNKIILHNDNSIPGKILRFLVEEKVNSLETRILFKRINFEVSRISKICARRPFFIIPEDTDAARGRLVAMLAKAKGCKVLVFLPLYYDWITTYPLLGRRLADYWVICGNNYRSRLIKSGVGRGQICANKINIAKKTSDDNTEKAELPRPYYLVALQDNEEQEAAVQFILDAAKFLPDVNIIFKYHPSTSAKTRKYLKMRYNACNVYFEDGINLNAGIKNSSGLITISSTTILNAVYYNKPVLVIDVGFFFHELHLLAQRTKAFDIIRNPKQLADLLTMLERKDFRKKYIRRQQILKKEYLIS